MRRDQKWARKNKAKKLLTTKYHHSSSKENELHASSVDHEWIHHVWNEFLPFIHSILCLSINGIKKREKKMSEGYVDEEEEKLVFDWRW